ELNPAFLFTLATHIQYAIDRTEEYGEIINPLNYELKYIYPKEYRVAQWAKNFLVNEYELNLYDSEITFFTLHFVNGL
ncbi:PRD domain-containing protein, partial [Brucella melitensis]|uniref:PRD domain-containing protein n=1 Tax=Brucella melitensis TaxID=29459 RepID=UPI003B67B66E